MISKPTILIVDDTKATIKIIIEALKSEYETQVALNGKDALAIVKDSAPDLILLDIVMPGMDGYEVCKALKLDESTKEIPIIFITALDEEQNETKGFQLGAVDFITKPIRPPILCARVKNHLELKTARETLKKQNSELKEAASLKEHFEIIARPDLKTPLSIIIGMPEMIVADNLTEEQVKGLKMIEKAGFRMLDMINISLDLFKMERKLYQLSPGTVDVAHIIKRVRTDLQSIIRTKGITVKVLKGDSPLEENDSFNVTGEDLLLYSMLANLIKNALEASPKHEDITIRFDQAEWLKISIKNKGLVPKEIRKTFFDKYVSSGKSKGTGLGTYSAKLIAEAVGGSISLNTSQELYTSIEILLPNV